ncbi:MAG: SDR family oxidoreductase [Acidimicrobiales bacterium]|nr:SDR family oxidoreductase [Acidimicrobiales bacterium]
MQRFEDKVVLVTGAASGIGRATVERLAAEGATLACVDVQAEAVQEVASAARAAGASARSWVCDISDEAAVVATVADVVDELGRLDSLCNVAGILRTATHSHEVSLAQWDQLLAVNLTGTFLVTRECLPHLLATGGNIVMTASTSSLAGHPWMLAYAASKGGVLAMTYTLAVEYGKRGLRVNAVAPGGVETPIREIDFPSEGLDFDLFARISPLDQVRGPETVASAIAFLASDDAAHVNGECLRVDGATLA